jgi:hypothetical protein
MFEFGLVHPFPKSNVMVFGNAPGETVTVAQLKVPLFISGDLLPDNPRLSVVSSKRLFASSVRLSLMACFPVNSKVVSTSPVMLLFFLQELNPIIIIPEMRGTSNFIFCISYIFVLQSSKIIIPFYIKTNLLLKHPIDYVGFITTALGI